MKKIPKFIVKKAEEQKMGRERENGKEKRKKKSMLLRNQY